MKRIGPVVVLADGAMAEAERWLRVNNFVFDNLVADDGVASLEPLRQRQITQIRGKGRVDFFIAPEPETVWWAVSEGIPSLFFVHPQFAAPVARKDSNRGRKAWADIEAEVDRRQKVAAEVAEEVLLDADL